MKLQRKEYIEAVRYYEIDITERDLEDLNAEIIEANATFEPLTFEDIRNYMRFDIMWDKGREEIIDSYFSTPFKMRKVELYDYLTEWLNERFWDNEVDMDTLQLFDVQLREID